ncbi:MAG: DUF1732 domain-containing protein [Candidatus Cloacimonetes bacterium]|nr:DUF1732 domain-containing protein [Candidatus Cloacimonadota bacterium]
MKSMTGFGKASHYSDEFDIEIQLRSVNNRFLDMKLYLPNELSFLDIQARKMIQEKISRGTLELRVNYRDKRLPNATLDFNKLEMYNRLSQQVASYLEIEYTPDIDKILENNDLIIMENEDLDDTQFSDSFMSVLATALDLHQKMAMQEGESMNAFFRSSITKMLNALLEIEEYFIEHKAEIHDKLKGRVLELFNDHLTEENEKRILLETAIYIDKSDVNEEITRLRNHINKLSMIIEETDSEPIGKTLNFIMQEMHREANTLGSKFSTTSSFGNVLILKEEIDKCKEMVLNVE